MNFRTLDLNLLRVFDEVMAERNLTRAANNLAMTQPAVSNALKRLRDAVGDDLLVRAGYGVEPTPRALALWPIVREALTSLRATIAPQGFDPKVGKHSFVLSMADSTAALAIPPLVREIEAMKANITLRVLPLTTRDPRALLEAGTIDLAIGFFPAAVAAVAQHSMQSDAPDTFHHTQLYEGEYKCVLRKGHPLLSQLKKGGLTLDQYCSAHHLLVSFSGRPFGFIDEALADINRTRAVVLTVNQFFTAGGVVANSDLLTVLPRHFLASTGMMDQLVSLPLPFPAPVVRVDLLWHRHHHNNPAQKWLREMIARIAPKAFAVETKAANVIENAATLEADTPTLPPAAEPKKKKPSKRLRAEG
jgi:DNA-binding transcriptional LysR family regulator